MTIRDTIRAYYEGETKVVMKDTSSGYYEGCYFAESAAYVEFSGLM